MKMIYALKEPETSKTLDFVAAENDQEARELLRAGGVGGKLEIIPYPGVEYVRIENAIKNLTKLLKKLEEETLNL